jgi:O-antigen ligase
MFVKIIDKIQENYFISYVYLFIFLAPWKFFGSQMGIMSLILFIWWLIVSKQNNSFKKLKTIFKFKPLLLLLLFLLLSYSSVLWSSNLHDSIDSLNYYKYYWIIIPVILTTFEKEEAINSLYIIFFSLFLYALFVLLIYCDFLHVVGPYPDLAVNSNNPTGIMPYAVVTPYMAIGSLSSIFLLQYSKNKLERILFTIMSISFTVAMLINNGRAGQLAFFLTLILLFFSQYRLLKNIKFLLVSIALLFLSIYGLLYFDKLSKIKAGYLELQNAKSMNFDSNWGSRAYMWYIAKDSIIKNPFFGVGIGGQKDVIINYSKKHMNTHLRTFHNQHLDTLVKLGVIGYGLLLGSVLLLLYKLRKEKLYFMLGIVFFSITFFDSFGDILLLMKPYNNIFILFFVLFSIISNNQTQSK